MVPWMPPEHNGNLRHAPCFPPRAARPKGEPNVPAPGLACRWGSYSKPTPWSRLPARALVASGDRSAPTEVATSTGSRQSATGARSPPPAPIPRRCFLPLWRGRGIIIYNLIPKGAWRPPLWHPPRFTALRLRGSSLPWGHKGGLRHCQINGGKGSLYKRGFTKGEASPPPLELDYIKPSPFRTAKVRIIAFVPLREGAGGGALVSSKATGETRRRPHKSCPACGKIPKSSLLSPMVWYNTVKDS